jgi:hypothetical protein
MTKIQKELEKMPPSVQASVKKICTKIREGISIRDLGAKPIERFKDSSRYLSIPAAGSYRLIVQRTKTGLVPVWVGTHQKYDKILKH